MDAISKIPSMMLNADYSAIEARIVCWLAGQEDALRDYRNGIDRYRKMASLIYGTPADQVNEFPQRFVGKQATLGCGFGMGAKKFRSTCEKYQYYDLPEGLEEKAVSAFRAAHPRLSNYENGLWKLTERAALKAITSPGKVITVNKFLAFSLRKVGKINFLLLRLPSGRLLSYPEPAITQDPEWGPRITFYGAIKDKAIWGRVSTYGGKLVENATQAVAVDIMSHGACKAEAKGYEIATLIHDEALGYYRPEKGQTIEEFSSLLASSPLWADGLPLEVKGQLVPFYTK